MIKDVRDYSLLGNNSFGIEAVCGRFLEFSSTGELHEVVNRLRKEDLPMLIVGKGCNLLFSKDFPGAVLHSAIKGKEVSESGDDVFVRCGSGEVWDDIIVFALAHDWHGMENLSLIPSEAGAAAVQNIGAYGVEAKDVIQQVEAVETATNREVVFSNEDCGFGYRKSKFKREWLNQYIITHVTLRLSKTFVPNIGYRSLERLLGRKGITNPTARQIRESVIEIRKSKLPDPDVIGNAGSFFVNPVVSEETYASLAGKYADMPHFSMGNGEEKVPAGWLIEQCGWKGKRLKQAGVFEKNALVLVNLGGATGKEVISLMRKIQHDVKGKFGIDIYPEVKII